MSDYLVSARKYRPVNFDDVVGQELITNSLNNAIKNSKLGQALLFTGPKGVGKTSCARIVAREINGFELNDDNFYNIFELDAASNNGVESIRNLIEQTRIPPQYGKFKVYIIDEAHMLSSGAFNAFLKTLEEPPSHCIFILATTEKHKIIPTILSRCQTYNFKRISNDDILKHLKKICALEKIKYEDDALKKIANKSDGSLRDGLQLFDKIVGVNKQINLNSVLNNINSVDFDSFLDIYKLIQDKDIPKLIVSTNIILEKGIPGDIFLSEFSSFIRDILISKNDLSKNLLIYDNNKIKMLNEISENVNYDVLINYIDILNNAEINFQKSLNQKLLIELTLLKITSLKYDDEKKKIDFELIPKVKFKNQVFLKNNLKTETEKKLIPTAAINKLKFKTPALSLKSIEKNKEFVELKQNENIIYDNSIELNIQNILDTWNEYANEMEKSGRYNIASILRISMPEFDNKNKITYKVPNNTTAFEVDSEKKLVLYLRNKLDRKIELSVVVDKKIEKAKIYTDKDKYDLMKKKNPNIEELKKTFKLFI
tara:strand:- start:573 stop:2198 length:1626 start_codon:yes stop_codon:yes gene_type:complete